jgi:hypothetical protein
LDSANEQQSGKVAARREGISFVPDLLSLCIKIKEQEKSGLQPGNYLLFIRPKE